MSCPCGEKHGPNSEVFYVSAVDGPRWVALLGPFETHEAALAKVAEGRKLAEDFDPRAVWYGIGTIGAPKDLAIKVKFQQKEAA